MPQTVIAKRRPRKRCTSCQRRKALSRFTKHCHRPDGHDSECKDCKAERTRVWYQKRQEETQGLYSTFKGMKQRCHNPNHDHYHYYGGRGIEVCEEWRTDFHSFVRWALGEGYEPGLQIDRINNDRGYFPTNCRFVTPAENARNKRKPRRSANPAVCH